MAMMDIMDTVARILNPASDVCRSSPSPKKGVQRLELELELELRNASRANLIVVLVPRRIKIKPVYLTAVEKHQRQP